ncbi:hypothetical protein O988_05072 [Pseudogymnoascus sp. VKM F-3808]|nr:hypothetical protein O988_05072 [Pseudogymnoascus sp. VKM F-3808]
MRTSIILAAVALLTPSLAAYTCPSSLGPLNTPKCCVGYSEIDCTDPSEAPKNFSDFLRLCGEANGKDPNCCLVLPGTNSVADCRPAPVTLD